MVSGRVALGEALERIVTALATGAGVDEVVNAILAEVAQQLGARTAYLALREGDRVVVVASLAGDPPVGASRPTESGIEGWTLRYGATAVVADVRRDLRSHDPLWMGATAAVAAAPVRLYGQPGGALVALTSNPRRFTDHELWWLSIFGTLAAVAIENNRALRAERRRARQTELLLELTVLDSTEPDRLVQAAAKVITRGLGVDKTDVMLLDSTGQELVARGIAGGEMARAEQRVGLDRIPLAAGGELVEVFQTGQPLLVQHAADVPALRRLHDEIGVESLMAVPVYLGGRRQGLIQVARGVPQAFTNDDLAFLTLVAGRVAVELERAELARQQQEIQREQARQQAHKDFLGLVTHELKTPIAVLQAYTELLIRRAEGDRRRDDLEVLTRMMDQADRMLGMIDQLLDSQRLEEGLLALDRGRFDLAELARRQVDAVQLTAKNQTIVVEAAEPAPVLADRRRIEDVISNLLNNAIKFSPPGGRITVTVRRQPSESGPEAVVLAVADEGPGIEPQDRERVFERFFQARSTLHRGHVGLGLGLYVSREVVVRHGGRIWIEPNLPRGTQVAFSLPLQPSVAV